MKEQIAMALSGVMEQAMSILSAEVADSSSTPRLKHRRCYVNYNREADHLRL
jgi:hypothetical protein